MNTQDSDTGFKDKTGTPIRLGDMVQLRAADHAADKSLFVVAQKDEQTALFVPGTETNPHSPGVVLSQEIADVLIVVKQAGE